MQANLTKLPAIPDNCFYFVDNPKALKERDGARARDLNPKRKRPVRGHSGLDRKGVPLTRAERVANYAWFYAAARAEGLTESPFDD